MESDFNNEFHRINREFFDMRTTLVNDVQVLLRQLIGKNKQVLRRTVYRAMFAYIEGIVFVLKKEMLLYRKQEGWNPQGRKMRFLTEQKEVTNGSGQAVSVPYYVPLSRSIPCVFRIYADVHWFEFEVETTNHGWTCLVKAAKVRNRVTHPKCVQDLAVSDEEVYTMMHAVKWFDSSLINLFDECGRSCLQRAEALRRCEVEN